MNQEEGCPSVDAVREAHDARAGRDTATGNTWPTPKKRRWRYAHGEIQALPAWSRGS